MFDKKIIRIIKQPIKRSELKKIAEERYGDLVKAVVDIKKEIMAIGGELHSDEEAVLLEEGSEQNHLWGINIYPDLERDNWIEFDSIINIRPAYGNNSRFVEDEKIREKIKEIVNKLIID